MTGADNAGAAWDAVALHPDDGVATALRALTAGESVRVRRGEGIDRVTAADDIPLCHKIALRPLAANAPIRKYGEPIGRAIADIAAGAWVHVHNMRSVRALRREESERGP
ncbi:MAG: UxaA family hydrolase [Inquilinaceae bacterium]